MLRSSAPYLKSALLNTGRLATAAPHSIRAFPGARPPCRLPHPALSSPVARTFTSSRAVAHGHVHEPKPGEELHVTFITKDGDQHQFEVAAGDNLMDIAQAKGMDMEGACGGSCACSTCHVIVDPEYYDRMEEPSDDENDMLDLAFGLTETSRLACQVVMNKDLDGIRVALPAMTRNLQAKDFDS